MVRAKAMVLALGPVLACICGAEARAQYVTYYRPMVSYYAPAPVVAPVPYTVASPVTYTVAAPVVAPAPFFAPAPAPVVTYYRAPAVSYAPVPQVVTRWRPLLGGTVSRVRYNYMPVVY